MILKLFKPRKGNPRVYISKNKLKRNLLKTRNSQQFLPGIFVVIIIGIISTGSLFFLMMNHGINSYQNNGASIFATSNIQNKSTFVSFNCRSIIVPDYFGVETYLDDHTHCTYGQDE